MCVKERAKKNESRYCDALGLSRYCDALGIRETWLVPISILM